MSAVFKIPNFGKNVSVEELLNGIRLSYVLSCPKEFPNKTFQSGKKFYYRKSIVILYDENMSKRIDYAYRKVKNSVMLDLKVFKKNEYLKEITNLEFQQLTLKNYI